MKKVIYFYDDALVKKHGGFAELKAFARSKRYQLRDASLSTNDGVVEQADEYKGAVPSHYEVAKAPQTAKPEDEAAGGSKPTGNTVVDPTA